MSEVINLTPHAVSLADTEGNIVKTFPPCGQVARVTTTAEVVGELAGFPVSRSSFGDVVGVPAPREGVVYLVSALVAQAAKRPDVVAPDTGSTALRKDGQVVAVRGFVTF